MKKADRILVNEYCNANKKKKSRRKNQSMKY